MTETFPADIAKSTDTPSAAKPSAAARKVTKKVAKKKAVVKKTPVAKAIGKTSTPKSPPKATRSGKVKLKPLRELLTELLPSYVSDRRPREYAVDGRYLDVVKLAKRLGVTTQCLYRVFTKGQLPPQLAVRMVKVFPSLKMTHLAPYLPPNIRALIDSLQKG